MEQEKWVNAFTRLLKKRNHIITLYDIDSNKKSTIASKLGCKSSETIQELTKTTDAIIICTPLESTPKVIQETLKVVTDTTLIEIASLKKRTVPALKKSSKNVRTISIHPMFGPDTEDLHNKPIIIIPVKNKILEEKITKELFPDAKHIVLDMDTHDRFMSLILALPYFINVVFLKCLPVENIDLLKSLAGPTFKTQYALAECILGEDPHFVKTIIEDNVFVRDNLNDFVYEFKYLRRLLKNRPSELGNYFLGVKNSLGIEEDFELSRRLRNNFLQSLSE